MKSVCIFITLLFTIFLYNIYSADWYVATDGTGDGSDWANATSITNAAANASSGETIWITNGLYSAGEISGNFVTLGAGVIARSISGLPADVILDANAMGRTVTMGSGAWLIGVTVRQGINDLGNQINGGSVSNCNLAGIGPGGSDYYSCSIYNCNIYGSISTITFNSCVVYNSIITGNTAGLSESSYLYNCTIVNDNGDPVGTIFINCIYWNNTNPLNFDWGNTVTYSCGLNFTTGTGNITNNPLFVGGSDYRLQSGSPCINIGNNAGWVGLSTSKDMDGNERIWPQGGTVDMGAYEYGSQSEYPGPKYFLWRKP